MTSPRTLLLVLGSWAVGGCCTDAGCTGLLTIHLDRALSTDAVVSVDLGDGTVVDCLSTSDPSGDGDCTFGPSDGEEVITVQLGTEEPPATALVRISEGGDEAVEHEVQVTASEPYSPNGKRCDPTCTGGRADLVL